MALTLPDHHLSDVLDRARDRIPVPRIARAGAPASLPWLADEDRSSIVSAATRGASGPWTFPRASQFARYWRDGVRADYEDDVKSIYGRTSAAVLAAVVTGEARWIDEAGDGLMLLCQLSTWAWVAHDDCHDRRGWAVPDPDSPFLDLGAAETVQVLAWADLALGSALDERLPGLRDRMRREARARVVRPYLDRHDWHWLKDPLNNWTAWIHQHLIAAALLLLDRPEDRADRARVVEGAVVQLNRYLVSLPVDGGIDEGYSYWWNGARRFIEAAELLTIATDGAIGLPAADIAELARFPQRMALGHDWYVNAADGPARPPVSQPWHVLHRAGRRLDDRGVLRQAEAGRRADVPLADPATGLGTALMALGDPVWCRLPARAPEDARPPLPRTSWLPGIQVLVAREQDGAADGLALAVKGGHNGESHNHLDVGSCIVAVDGSPVLIDLGQPTYTAQTFGPRRYEIWAMQSGWHNLPVIGGREQLPGAGHGATGVRPILGDRATGLELDIAGAYPLGDGTYTRRAQLLRDGDTRVEIADMWSLPAGTTVELHHILAGQVMRHDAGILVIRALSGATATLDWDPEMGAGALEEARIDDPLLARSWGAAVHRLILHPASGRASATITVRTP